MKPFRTQDLSPLAAALISLTVVLLGLWWGRAHAQTAETNLAYVCKDAALMGAVPLSAQSGGGVAAVSCKTHEVTTMHYVTAGLTPACRNTAAPEAPKEPALNGPAQQLEALLKSLREVNARLLQVADRFTGSIPRPESDGLKSCSPVGVVGLYHQIADDYASEMRRLHETLQRLEAV